MKKIQLLMSMFCMMFVLSGCFCEHEWAEASCIEPITCIHCGKTDGDPLGHEWGEATCVTAKTCSVCGETEGDLLPHSWVAATCRVPKTCSVCDTTEGDALPHNWTEDSTEVTKTCVDCNKYYEYYYYPRGVENDDFLFWTEYDIGEKGELLNPVSCGSADEKVVWTSNGEVCQWKDRIYNVPVYYVDGKVYFGCETAECTETTVQRLANAARSRVSFKYLWYSKNDYSQVTLTKNNDAWEYFGAEAGSAYATYSIDGKKYVIVHLGPVDQSLEKTYAIKRNW